MTENQKSEVFAALNMPPNESLDVYLGHPAFIGRNKTQIFDAIKMRVWRKLQGWKRNLFSAGGREVLINVVAQATSI